MKNARATSNSESLFNQPATLGADGTEMDYVTIQDYAVVVRIEPAQPPHLLLCSACAADTHPAYLPDDAPTIDPTATQPAGTADCPDCGTTLAVAALHLDTPTKADRRRATYGDLIYAGAEQLASAQYAHDTLRRQQQLAVARTTADALNRILLDAFRGDTATPIRSATEQHLRTGSDETARFLAETLCGAAHTPQTPLLALDVRCPCDKRIDIELNVRPAAAGVTVARCGPHDTPLHAAAPIGLRAITYRAGTLRWELAVLVDAVIDEVAVELPAALSDAIVDHHANPRTDTAPLSPTMRRYRTGAETFLERQALDGRPLRFGPLIGGPAYASTLSADAATRPAQPAGVAP